MSEQNEQVVEWLEELKGQTLFIQKDEFETGKNDVLATDKVRFQLDSVGFKNNRNASIDDYVANEEIVLYGSGTIETAQGETDLPENVYEIPLTGEVKANKQDPSIRLRTEDAMYTIFT
jgi:hypothetical protein